MHHHLLPSPLLTLSLLLLLAPHLIASAAVSTILTTASTITVSAALPTSTDPSFTSNSTFQTDILKAHNFYRSEHNTSALVWNNTLATFGQSWSSGCEFTHSSGPYGENLVAGYANATSSIDAWGLERTLYNFNSPGFSEKTGHFTQLVWSNTTSVGCGRTSCQGSNNTPGWYIVCEYFPRGNVVGDNGVYFKDNVKKQTEGGKGDTVESGVTSAAAAGIGGGVGGDGISGGVYTSWGAVLGVLAGLGCGL